MCIDNKKYIDFEKVSYSDLETIISDLDEKNGVIYTNIQFHTSKCEAIFHLAKNITKIN
ncbi:hypothetical protein PIROE2DRAFT_10568 [Piromyces sp. E2]|nr:hypothetical protein PIROE2DRAFT_10568 [Piromyces sp. E2]|eukprot:OUM62992.1 hypothetical protein PIROE2DRAFT_10568 [Piromyces sp. E2]